MRPACISERSRPWLSRSGRRRSSSKSHLSMRPQCSYPAERRGWQAAQARNGPWTAARKAEWQASNPSSGPTSPARTTPSLPWRSIYAYPRRRAHSCSSVSVQRCALLISPNHRRVLSASSRLLSAPACSKGGRAVRRAAPLVSTAWAKPRSSPQAMRSAVSCTGTGATGTIAPARRIPALRTSRRRVRQGSPRTSRPGPSARS